MDNTPVWLSIQLESQGFKSPRRTITKIDGFGPKNPAPENGSSLRGRRGFLVKASSSVFVFSGLYSADLKSS